MANIVIELLLAALLAMVGWTVAYMAFEPSTEQPRTATSGATLNSHTPKSDRDGAGTDEDGALLCSGWERRFLIHRPHNYTTDKKWPLVVCFHSMYSNAKLQMQQSGINSAADKDGFIAVYPEGVFSSFNAGKGCSRAADENIDDVGFIRKLLSRLKDTCSVDPSRIYATGLGNGGSMCYRLAQEMSGDFAAICSVDGDMSVLKVSPPYHLPILHIHGMVDPIVPFEGGLGKNEIQRRTHRPVEKAIAQWRQWNGCEEKPSAVEENDIYTCLTFSPSSPHAGAPVVLYKIKDGGHTWPGGTQILPSSLFGKQVDDFDANAAIWKFFREHTLASSSDPKP